MMAVVEEAFMILAQAVIVLVVRRGESGAHDVGWAIAGAAIEGQTGGAVLVVVDGLVPAVHMQERLAIGGAEVDVRRGCGTAKELRCSLVAEELCGRGAVGVLHRNDHAIGFVDVGGIGL